MRIIGFLKAICKKKRMDCDFHPPCAKIRAGIRILALAAVFCLPMPGLALGADQALSTRDNESTISRDPASGDRVMRTPDPKPQEDYQGPQTIIISPEVYPDRREGGGHGDHRPKPPHRPQPR